MDHTDHKTNFRNRSQHRKQGTGKGRICRPWVSKWGWMLIAAERLCVYQAGSETSLLKNRDWATKWGITPQWLGRAMEERFPGILQFLLDSPGGPNPLRDLQNRIYKMYYSGSSDRGFDHNPKTRAAPSKEHWRLKDYKLGWEGKIISIVNNQLVCRTWKGWL